MATIVLLTIGLMRKAAGGGPWVNVGKVLVFSVLILGGLWVVAWQPLVDTGRALRPFFTAGFGGLVQAMGYTFIALQGFDLIAAVGDEVRAPTKTLPRAMILSLAIALAIYLPLLFVIDDDVACVRGGWHSVQRRKASIGCNVSNRFAFIARVGVPGTSVVPAGRDMIGGAGIFPSDRSCHNAGKGSTTPDGCQQSRVSPVPVPPALPDGAMAASASASSSSRRW